MPLDTIAALCVNNNRSGCLFIALRHGAMVSFYEQLSLLKKLQTGVQRDLEDVFLLLGWARLKKQISCDKILMCGVHPKPFFIDCNWSFTQLGKRSTYLINWYANYDGPSLRIEDISEQNYFVYALLSLDYEKSFLLLSTVKECGVFLYGLRNYNKDLVVQCMYRLNNLKYKENCAFFEWVAKNSQRSLVSVLLDVIHFRKNLYSTHAYTDALIVCSSKIHEDKNACSSVL